ESVLFVEVHEHLRVGAGAEHVTAPLEIGPELLEVVDLAIAHDPEVLVLVRDRLMSAADVDDAEPPHAERDPRRDVATLVVRTAVLDDPADPGQDLARGLMLPAEADDAVDAAHGSAHRPGFGAALRRTTNREDVRRGSPARARRPRDGPGRQRSLDALLDEDEDDDQAVQP